MDKVVALLCNYEHHEYIEQAYRSLISQSYENLEIIVIDDGSSVSPWEYIDKVDTKGRKVTRVSNKTNKGKWHCLNQAIGSTNAEWFMIQDADDFAFPWKARVQIESLKQTKTLLNLAGYVPISANASHIIPSVPSFNDIPTIVGEEIMHCAVTSLQNPMINHNYTGQHELHNGATMFHRSFHDIGFRFLPPGHGLRLTRSEDSDYNLRASLIFGRTSWTPIKCYSYRLGSGHPEGSF
tara:strand:- start:80 stop:793 length:714 start_codon:yes stop_codon:yes gene_type:complete